MKRDLKTSLSNRMEQMSTKELIGIILILVALITLVVLIGLLIGQTIDEGEVGIGWIARLGAALL